MRAYDADGAELGEYPTLPLARAAGATRCEDDDTGAVWFWVGGLWRTEWPGPAWQAPGSWWRRGAARWRRFGKGRR